MIKREHKIFVLNHLGILLYLCTITSLLALIYKIILVLSEGPFAPIILLVLVSKIGYDIWGMVYMEEMEKLKEEKKDDNNVS